MLETCMDRDLGPKTVLEVTLGSAVPPLRMVRCNACQRVVSKRQGVRRQEPGAGEAGVRPFLTVVTGASGAVQLFWGSSIYHSLKKRAWRGLRSGFHEEEMGLAGVGAERLLPRWSVFSTEGLLLQLDLTGATAGAAGSFEFESDLLCSCG